jgi:hypothetical protein
LAEKTPVRVRVFFTMGGRIFFFFFFFALGGKRGGRGFPLGKIGGSEKKKKNLLWGNFFPGVKGWGSGFPLGKIGGGSALSHPPKKDMSDFFWTTKLDSVTVLGCGRTI